VRPSVVQVGQVQVPEPAAVVLPQVPVASRKEAEA